MPLSEFELIERYFARGPVARGDVRLGVGDDAAVLAISAGHEAVAGLATVVLAGQPPARRDPRRVGHHVLALALSRLAATGAEPAWATLSITLPAADEAWLAGFRDGFSALAERFGVQLVGGDTTRGAGVVTVVAHGLVPRARALRCDGARAGESIYVTGSLGGCALAERPGQTLRDSMPRVGAGVALRDLASAAADIPCGLARGLTTILRASGLGATLQAASVPLEPALGGDPRSLGGWPGVLTSGGDLELCFTVTPARAAQAEAACAVAGARATRVGYVESASGLRCVGAQGERIPLEDMR
ncbi:MAG: thiamine-phosphate kinase [Gammaproteobacteria bacterium]|nr:thiamine-phosphate kinase [Gammaproteobacteria bacterium]NIR85125.1 thiamine-phosphate kinase [Gammaproteobacteria bacterium]NIR92054.1 thiamine-phosphate kinase [Gammaproteobacteria bacterium]NIU06174.1 thiamine-phosphate kinase [Gammaproteobacteria bacterium]NIV53173.1 thiamine-phosphate kinase [Gammaproteobacteria bacterium]